MSELSEKLGFGPDERVAIVHADDIGMCHAANEGAFAALRDGPATCGSLMVPCPWFQDAVDRAAQAPGIDLGVHLTLTAEWPHYRWGPVAGRRAVPSLLDDQGYLPRTIFEVAARAKPEEVAIELRAQVEMALAAGIDVTHVDTHMGTCFLPPFVDLYADVAEEFRVPAFAPRPDEATMRAAGLQEVPPAIQAAFERLEAHGFPLLDGFDQDSLGFEPGTGAAHNRSRLEKLTPGIHYLICHPAAGGPELEAITPDSAHQRDFEAGYYGGAPGRDALAAAGVRTLGMRPLRDLLRA